MAPAFFFPRAEGLGISLTGGPPSLSAVTYDPRYNVGSIFPNVSGYDSAYGRTDYVVLYIANWTRPYETMDDVRLWTQGPMEVQMAVRDTEPPTLDTSRSSYIFGSDPGMDWEHHRSYTTGLKIGGMTDRQFRPFYLRRQYQPNINRPADDLVELQIHVGYN